MLTKKKVTIEIVKEKDEEVEYYIVKAPKRIYSSRGSVLEYDVINDITSYYNGYVSVEQIL